MNEMNWEKAFKMLLASNYLGFNITTEDGHWWIETLDDGWAERDMDKHHVSIRSKVYDGPLQALARIDAAMKACDGTGLLEGVYTDDWYLGDGTESNEGVYKDGKELT